MSLKAQELWEEDSLNHQKVWKSLSEALQKPDSVFRLDLSKHKLKEVPPEVFQLTELRELNLSRNHLTEIPENITNFQTFSDCISITTGLLHCRNA